MQVGIYKTRDLSIASFLLTTKKVKLSGTQKHGQDIWFIFTPNDKAEQLVLLYWSDQAPSIQPRQLFQSLRSLKDLIFAQI